MSQASYVIDGSQDGAGYTTDLNAALDAGLTNNAGASAPTAGGQPKAYQLWADTTAGVMKIRNAANTAWITLGPLAGFLGNGLVNNLSITHTPGGATMTSVTVAAALISVQGTVLVNPSVTLSTAAGNGAAKLDTGAWATSTWYAVHLICNEDGSSVAALASLSATAPTLPGGYTRFRRVGWVRTDPTTATNLKATQQFGKKAYYVNDCASQRPVNAVAGTTTPQTVGLSASVPPGTRVCGIQCLLAGSPTAGTILALQQGGSSMGSGGRVASSYPGGTAGLYLPVENVVLDASQQLRWFTSVASGTVTIDVTMWEDPLL